jgi:hypothetical protein
MQLLIFNDPNNRCQQALLTGYVNNPYQDVEQMKVVVIASLLVRKGLSFEL